MRVRDIKISIKSDEELYKEVQDVVKKIERGDKIKKHEGISFEDMDTLRKVLSDERIRILKTIRKGHPQSIYELAKMLHRDIKNTFNDVQFLADAGLMRYASRTYPKLRLHLSVQGSATNYEAINFYHEHFGIQRAVLPRVLSLPQVEQLVKNTPVEIELFGFGGLCVMVEGRCVLSSYVTGESPNTAGVCSPAKAVRWQQTPQGLESRLNGILLDRYGAGENAGYPTLCKGRFDVNGETYYAIEEPASLNTLELIPEMLRMGISAVKIEGRQRSPVYVEQVTKVWRAAIDSALKNAESYTVNPAWMAQLNKLAEGQQNTLGAYHRPWK